MTHTLAGAAPARRAAHPILGALKALYLRVRNRIAVRTLNDWDDHMLNDVGLTRADVEQALALPYWCDPSLRLNWRASRRWAAGSRRATYRR